MTDIRRAERKPVQMHAVVREAGSTRVAIEVLDLSAAGFRFESLYSYAVGARIFLSIPSLRPLEAVVAWRKGSHYGCRFAHPLHVAVLETIAARFG